METAAVLMLCGFGDPIAHLHRTDPVEQVIIARAARRAQELRRQEFRYLAGLLNGGGSR